MSFQSLLNKTVTIQTKGTSVDATGSPSGSWSNTATVRGRLVAWGGTENTGDNRASIGTRRLILSNVDTSGDPVTLTHEQRILVDSVPYDVLSDAQDAAGHGHHLEAPVEVVT